MSEAVYPAAPARKGRVRHARNRRNCTKKPSRKAVDRSSIASDRRFSASRTRLVMLVKHTAVEPARTHPSSRNDARDIPKNPVLAIRGTNVTTIPMKPMIIPIKIRADIARACEAAERNRHKEHTHIDHMNRTHSEMRIVNRSIPPSRKLMAMNGASPQRE
jgi:hypothetical protein